MNKIQCLSLSGFCINNGIASIFKTRQDTGGNQDGKPPLWHSKETFRVSDIRVRPYISQAVLGYAT